MLSPVARSTRTLLLACLISACVVAEPCIENPCTESCTNIPKPEGSASLLQSEDIPKPEGSASLLQISSGMPSTNSGKQHITEEPTTVLIERGDEDIEEEDWKRGLHGVVGKDGVLMISLTRNPSHSLHSRHELAKVGIHPTMFEATDGSDPKVSEDYLSKALDWDTVPEIGREHWKPGSIHARSVSALADSHKRALEAAQHREEDWTAIFEDDVIPSSKSMGRQEFFQAFESVWAKIPPFAKLVRLGYCQLKLWDPKLSPSQASVSVPTFADGGKFRATRWYGIHGHYQAGGCTTAYLVHRSIIPEILSWFPCDCTLDCCWNKRFNHKHHNSEFTRGHDFLFNIETHERPDDAFHKAAKVKGYESCAQFGILKQDWEKMPWGTTRKSFKFYDLGQDVHEFWGMSPEIALQDMALDFLNSTSLSSVE